MTGRLGAATGQERPPRQAGSGRRGENRDIRLVQPVETFRERDGLSAELGGQGLSLVEAAVADEELARALGAQMAHGGGGHGPRSEDHDDAFLELVEDAAGQDRRRPADRSDAADDAGLVADLFAYHEGALKGQMAVTGGRLLGAGALVGGLALPQNLGLADHPGVQTGGDAEKMADGLGTAADIKGRGDVASGAANQPFDHGLLAVLVGLAIDLEAAAGGDDDDAFLTGGLPDEGVDASRLMRLRGNGLTDLDGGRRVIESDHQPFWARHA